MSPQSPTKDLNANKNSSNKSSEDTFPYPICWKDDVRMGVLLAPFRERSVNVQNYDSKMKFWQNLIEEYCQYHAVGHFNKQDLQLQFARGSALPYCLDDVIDDMLRNKKIRTLSDYEYDPLNCWSGWAVQSFVRKPLFWGVDKLKNTIGLGGQDDSKLSKYVHLEVMKKFCQDLHLNLQQNHQGKLMHFENLQSQLKASNLCLNELCLRLCLHTLHCQHKIGLEYKQENKEKLIHLIKIPSKTDASVLITENDLHMHKLQMTQTNLLKQLDVIDEEIKSHDQKAKQCIKENKRQMAKTFLRKKHLQEKSHEKLSVALHNIETLQIQVQEARSNGEILDAYKIGSKALQNILNETGLKYDNVEEILSDVRETMDDHNEIQNSLTNANIAEGTAQDYDNDELEQELRDILGEEASKAALPVTPKSKTLNASVVAPQKIQITDEDLLAMLEDLEVADTTLASSVATSSTLTH